MSRASKQITRATVLFMAMFISCAIAGAAETAPPVDPAGGFKALEIGALRLADKQKEQVTIIAARPVAISYPAEALAQRISGRVVLDVVIESDGSVSAVKVLEEAPRGAGFGDAAVTAASKHKYRNSLERRVVRTLTLAFTTPHPDSASQPVAAGGAP